MDREQADLDLLMGLLSRRAFDKSSGRNRVCIAQEERMATKTTYFTITQLERLAQLARDEGVGEAVLLREALDDLLIKYRVSGVES